jgi:spermidine/putrescine transport system permease protein
MGAKLLSRLIGALVLIGLYAPLVVVLISSFNQSRNALSWEGFTWKWYGAALAHPMLLQTLGHSIILALASALISCPLGLLFSSGLLRLRKKRREQLLLLVGIPVFLPDIIVAIGLLCLFSVLRTQSSLFELGFPAMILSHVTLQLPFVTLALLGRFQRLDSTLPEAAGDLGATPRQIFWQVTFPQIRGALIGAFLLAATLSLDDFLLSFYSAGPGTTTLPIFIYSSVKRGLTPEIHVVSTLLIVLATATTLVALRLLGATLDSEPRIR